MRIPLGHAGEAIVRIRLEDGRLEVAASDDPDHLLEGEFGGAVRDQVREDGGRLDVTLRPAPARRRRNRRWRVRLAPSVPLELELLGGGHRVTADLSKLLVRRLLLVSVSGRVTLTLPERGRTSARIEAERARVDVRVPPEVAARVTVEGEQARARVDEGRFPRTGDVHRSARFEGAGDRVELTLVGRATTFSVC